MKLDSEKIDKEIKSIFGPGAEAARLHALIIGGESTLSKDVLERYGLGEKAYRVINFYAFYSKDMSDKLRELLGPRKETERFIERTKDVIEAKFCGSYQSRHRHSDEKSRALEIIEHVKALESALGDELTQHFKFCIARSRHAMGLTKSMSQHTGALLKELGELRVATEFMLEPRGKDNFPLPLADVPKPKAKHLDRVAFIDELMLAYESIFVRPDGQPGNAGHTRTSKFHLAMKIILPPAGWITKDPEAWIKEAKQVGWGGEFRP